MFSYLIFISSKGFRKEIPLTPFSRRYLLLGQEFPHFTKSGRINNGIKNLRLFWILSRTHVKVFWYTVPIHT
jgi:hypothetical protein